MEIVFWIRPEGQQLFVLSASININIPVMLNALNILSPSTALIKSVHCKTEYSALRETERGPKEKLFTQLHYFYMAWRIKTMA